MASIVIRYKKCEMMLNSNGFSYIGIGLPLLGEHLEYKLDLL